MSKVVELNEETSFSFRMPDLTVNIVAADDRNAKQQKRAVGELLKQFGSELCGIGQFDMGELFENMGKQFAGRGGGRKKKAATTAGAVAATTKAAVTITANDSVNSQTDDDDIDDIDNDDFDDDDMTLQELANSGVEIEDMELTDDGVEEAV